MPCAHPTRYIGTEDNGEGMHRLFCAACGYCPTMEYGLWATDVERWEDDSALALSIENKCRIWEENPPVGPIVHPAAIALLREARDALEAHVRAGF
jgi:hypothetical protein